MPIQNPLSIPGGWKKDGNNTPKDTPAAEEGNPVDSQTTPRTPAGVVSESGDILDQAGTQIGKIADDSEKDVSSLAGKDVTEKGDILDKDSGDVVGQASLSLDDSDEGDYTTKAGDAAGDAQDKVGDAQDRASEAADDTQSEAQEQGKKAGGGFWSSAKGAASSVGSFGGKFGGSNKAPSEAPDVGETAGNAKDTVQDTAEDATSELQEQAPISLDDKEKGVTDTDDVTGQADDVKDQAGDVKDDAEAKVGDTKDDVESKAEDVKDDAEATTDEAKEGVEGTAEDTKEGAEGTAEDTKEGVEGTADEAKEGVEGAADETKEGVEGTADEAKEGVEGATDETKEGAEGAADEAKEGAEDAAAEAEDKLDFTILKGAKVNKIGNLVNSDNQLIGRLTEGEAKKLQGRQADEDGNIWNDSGKIIGKAEPLPDNEREDLKDFAPFENFPDATVESDGRVMSEGRQVGTVVEGDAKRLKGSKVDEDGDILDRNGNTVGKAEAWDEPEPVPEEPEEQPDYSILKGATVNKTGNLVNDNGDVVGKVVEGEAKKLQGKRCDEDGNIWNDSGEKVGKAVPLSGDERDEKRKSFAPFENFPDAIVEADGRVTSEGRQVGTVVEGDAKRLKGSKVDEDGDILDRNGNTVGKAEAWDEPEPIPEEPEEIPDRSILAGKRVNKAGNLVDSAGTIFGKVVEGNVSAIVGRMSDKEGNIRSESGDIVGKAEVVAEGEREGSKEGPFAELSGLTVRKDGLVVTPSDEVVGKLTEGDAKKLSGRSVDEDGDVVDKNGNVLGKAERYEEPEAEEKEHGPLFGRKVNKEGNVVDADGNVIAKLVSGEILQNAGKEIDDDGDVINSKGHTVGHVALIGDIPAEEPGETEEEKKEREQAEADKKQADADAKLASSLAHQIEQAIEKVTPITKLIDSKIEACERTKEEDRDEDQLVKEVKPLIEEGGKILSETNGIIRGMDPDGRIQRQAKQNAGTKEATPEEHHLAEVLKDLTSGVTQSVDNAKRKLESMPKAKKQLNPLWGLLMEPLGQIIAAVGLLLTGVLGLVGKLLSGLGLGGLVDGLLGGLGLNKVLGSLGLGSAYDALVGKKK